MSWPENYNDVATASTAQRLRKRAMTSQKGPHERTDLSLCFLMPQPVRLTSVALFYERQH